MGDRSASQEVNRAVMGGLGVVLLGLMILRLGEWYGGAPAYRTVWEALAGRRGAYLIFGGRYAWDFGLWELFPDGQLAAAAMLAIVFSLIVGAVACCRSLYWLAGAIVVCGYIVNAALLLKLMAEY